MIHRFARMSALLAGAALLSGCLANERAGVSLPPGLIYTYQKAPLTAPRDDGPPKVILPDDVATGTSSFRKIDFSIPTLDYTRGASIGWGDGSWKTAMQDGNLEEAYFADVRTLKILNGLYTDIEIVIYGKARDAEVE